jgi:hypothetical protein
MDNRQSQSDLPPLQGMAERTFAWIDMVIMPLS